MESSNQQAIPLPRTVNNQVGQILRTSQNPPRSNVNQTRYPQVTYTPSPYNLSHALGNQYFVGDLDDLLMHLDKGTLHPVLEDLDVAKCREDRLLQMNEKLTEKVEELMQQQIELKDFIQHQAQCQDEQFRTLMHYVHEMFVQRIPTHIIPPLQQPLRLHDASPPLAPNNDDTAGGN